MSKRVVIYARTSLGSARQDITRQVSELKEIVCQQKYFYGHRSDDTYQKKHILLSDSFIRSLSPCLSL